MGLNTEQTYTTRAGEVLDAISWRIYGTEQAVHMIIAANPHVADLPPRLPAGTRLTLPAAPTPPAPVATVRLWGSR